MSKVIELGGLKPPSDIIKMASDFTGKFKVHEVSSGVPLLLLHDEESGAFYVACHLFGKAVAEAADLDAVLDPQESEDYKLNRELYVDNHAFKMMEVDAQKGRSFEDLVVEYDTSYRPELPLKVFGGQHRIQAITTAAAKGVSVAHGLRVYFGLTQEQKVDISVANNTSIAVSNDLLDRMQEDALGTELRTWCQKVGLLDKGQNFSDRRSSEGVPTVRVARTVIVDFHRGKSMGLKGDYSPVVCASGPKIDKNYAALRSKINWDEPALIQMGKELARLHKKQRTRVLGRAKDKYTEFANKTYHPCVAAAWSYAAGAFQVNPKALKAHYSLVESVDAPGDPLGATNLLNARYKGRDPDTYRGLGSRISPQEVGRMLEVFVLQAESATKPGITLELANVAIKSYHSKQLARETAEGLRRI